MIKHASRYLCLSIAITMTANAGVIITNFTGGPYTAGTALGAVTANPAGINAEAFGLLVLASPDAQRFNASMGTDFLERIGEIGSAALSRLQGAAV